MKPTLRFDLGRGYFKVGEKEVKTLTIDETLFKEFASAFVSADLKIALFDEPEEGKTFIDESDRVAAMQVDILPDYTVSQEQMHEYGYAWDGMLPVRIRTARVLYGTGVELYRLGKDDTEGKSKTGILKIPRAYTVLKSLRGKRLSILKKVRRI